MAPPCVVCGVDEGRMWTAREMMLGLGDEFEYFECEGCGCLQIAAIPSGLDRYYPADYYSFSPAAPPVGFRGTLRELRNRYLFTGKGVLGAVLARVTHYPYAAVAPWFARNPKGLKARVLDVGSGSGALVDDLARVGFWTPIGIDPFIRESMEYPSGARVLRSEIADVAGEFDLILLNHVFEHVPDPIGTLAAVKRLLAPGGECLVRTPTVSSYAWEHYRENWVQLDAPRHLVIHSTGSLEKSAESAGLRVSRIDYDSDELQFVGSELYRRGVPGMAERGTYPAGEVRAFRREARRLNAMKLGDQAAFVLSAP